MIHIKHLTKRYDNLTALDDVSLHVNREELLVLLGSSGCGKTTLLRLVAGLERPNGGEVWLAGEQVAGGNAWTPPELRRVGMVFQDYALFPHLTVEQNIAFALKHANGTARQRRIADMLDLVGLPGLGKRFPHQLSGGQQQRVALARALAPQPSVVLLDEPFSNLDAALRRFMREEVRRILREAEATAVFVTHDQEEAMSLADRVAVLNAGQLLQVGAAQELYRYPEVREVATFLGETNMLPGEADGDTAVTPLGVVRLARPASGTVEVMVRPEALTLTPDDDGNAAVQDVRFYGYYQLAALRLNDGTPLEARLWAQTEIAPGQSVRVGVQGAAVAFSEPVRV